MLRLIKKEDFSQIFELSKKVLIEGENYSEEYLKKICISNSGYCYLKNDIIIGYLLFTIKNNKKFIAQVCVNPNFQNIGICKILLKVFLLNNKNEDIFLHVRTSNLKAIHIYIKFGFKEINVEKDYYSYTSLNDDASLMKLTE
jgi:ribosomal-protein-alanine N-acetyltransferase